MPYGITVKFKVDEEMKDWLEEEMERTDRQQCEVLRKIIRCAMHGNYYPRGDVK